MDSEGREKTMTTCRYILGLDAPTDIDYAISLLREAKEQGDKMPVEH